MQMQKGREKRQDSEDGGDRCSGPGIRNSVGQTDGIVII